MENTIRDNKIMASTLYILPCKKAGSVDEYKLDKYELKRINDDINLRTLIRGDVIDFINNKMKVHRIDFNDNNVNAEICIRNIKGDDSNNTRTIFKLMRAYLIEIDVDNMFLVLNTCLPSDEIIVSSKDVIDRHSDFMNNYFKYDDNNKSAMLIRLNGNDYPLTSSSVDSISSLFKIEFDFDNFNARFLMVSTFMDPNIKMDGKNNEIYEFIDECVYLDSGSFIEKDYKSYRTERFITKSSNYGNVIAYKAIYDSKNNILKKANDKNMRAFYHELLYEYIIALNYKIRLEKFLIKIGKLKYETKSSKEFKWMHDDLLEYKRFSSESYFVNVSGIDFSNSWYHNVWDGLDIDILDNEVESKFKYSMDYIKVKLDELESKNRKINKVLNTYTAFIVSLALFILALIQSISCLYDTDVTATVAKVAVIVAGVVLGIKILLDILNLLSNRKTKH